MHRYSEFIDYLRRDFSSLVTSVEPLVSVKIKEELAVCLVRVAQKLGFPADYLSSIVIAEIDKIGWLREYLPSMLAKIDKIGWFREYLPPMIAEIYKIGIFRAEIKKLHPN